MTVPTAGGSFNRSLRIVLAEDSSLFREGLSLLLNAAGLQVLAELGDATELGIAIQKYQPDAVVLDARMPPTHTDEGIRAALQTRRDFPHIGVLLLSTYVESSWANQLFSAGSAGLGYLLKDRVNDTEALVEAIRRVSLGGTAVDPDVIGSLFELNNRRSALDVLTDRERVVLSLMAQGRSNAGIGRTMHLSPRTVEAYIASIFTKLPLDPDDSAFNRRVLAVLAYLQDPNAT